MPRVPGFVPVLVFIAAAVASGWKTAEPANPDPALEGVWTRKEGKLIVDFTAKDTLRVSPHGDQVKLAIVCKLKPGKDGVWLAVIDSYEGDDPVVEKLKKRLPAGLEFHFQWKSKENAATLEIKKGDADDLLKNHMDGEYQLKN